MSKPIIISSILRYEYPWQAVVKLVEQQCIFHVFIHLTHYHVSVFFFFAFIRFVALIDQQMRSFVLEEILCKIIVYEAIVVIHFSYLNDFLPTFVYLFVELFPSFHVRKVLPIKAIHALVPSIYDIQEQVHA